MARRLLPKMARRTKAITVIGIGVTLMLMVMVHDVITAQLSPTTTYAVWMTLGISVMIGGAKIWP